MIKEEIFEFRTTWNHELFHKNKSAYRAAKHLIKRSLIIDQIRLCRQLKYIENDLIVQLETVNNDKQILNKCKTSNSFAECLQQRLNTLENEINNYQFQIKNILNQEKEYWKQLEQIVSKKVNLCPMRKNSQILQQNSSRCRPLARANATFTTHVDKNDENQPPIQSQLSVKIPKIRKKKKITS